MEYRNLTPITKPKEVTTKRIDSEYYVEGYAARFKPYVLFEYDGIKIYEELAKDALIGADLSDVIMQYDHKGRVLARTTNGTLVLESDNHGLFIAADLSGSTASRDMHNDINTGLVTKMSWGFTVAEEEYNRDTRTRLIKKIKKVYDVSGVSIPANESTGINTRSYFNKLMIDEQGKDINRRKQRLRLKYKLTI